MHLNRKIKYYICEHATCTAHLWLVVRRILKFIQGHMPFGLHVLFCIHLQLTQGTLWVTESAEQHLSKLVQYQSLNKLYLHL